jgi:DNA mismatch repair ATPase MutS
MGHPLLPDRACVTNDIGLNDSTRFYIVSGSKMAGKSTLLRAIGQNAVLAAAGAPVRSSQARIAVMSVCASVAVGDSLHDGLRNSSQRSRGCAIPSKRPAGVIRSSFW